MTTIVATREAFYSDTRATRGNGFFNTRKIFSKDGFLVAASGSSAAGLKFMEWLFGGQQASEMPEFEEDEWFTALVLDPDGIIAIWEKSLAPILMLDDYYAIGSGSDYARGAMEAGASPQEAIEIAMRLDPGSGGQVDVVRAQQARKALPIIV